MAKTLKNRRYKRAKTQRGKTQHGGFLGMSSTIMKMRSFNAGDFKTVFDHLKNNTLATSFIDSWNGPVYDFNHFKSMYIGFRDSLNDAIADDNTADADALEKVLAEFKSIVKDIHDKKAGASGPNMAKARNNANKTRNNRPNMH
jgi:hypothetical protein